MKLALWLTSEMASVELGAGAVLASAAYGVRRGARGVMVVDSVVLSRARLAPGAVARREEPAGEHPRCHASIRECCCSKHGNVAGSHRR